MTDWGHGSSHDNRADEGEIRALGGPGEIVFADCCSLVGGERKRCIAVFIVNNQLMLEQWTSVILNAGSDREIGGAGADLNWGAELFRYEESLTGCRPPTRRPRNPEWRQQLDRIVEASRRPNVQTETVALGFELRRPSQRSYFDRGQSDSRSARSSTNPNRSCTSGHSCLGRRTTGSQGSP